MGNRRNSKRRNRRIEKRQSELGRGLLSVGGLIFQPIVYVWLFLALLHSCQKAPLAQEDQLVRDYNIRELSGKEIKELGFEDLFVTEDRLSLYGGYPSEMFGWISFIDDYRIALFNDNKDLGQVGDANCLSGSYISVLGESSEDIKQFDKQYVKLIGYWYLDSEFTLYPILNDQTNLCENIATIFTGAILIAE